MPNPRLALNPFLYGKPVPPAHLIGRHIETRTLFSRLANGESSAIVGEPHIGKSSLLRYLANEDARREWLGKISEQQICIEIDCEMLSANFTPNDFWQVVLARIQEIADGDELKQQCEIVRQNNFGSFTLEALFKLLAKQEHRVVLLIDEFDSLLNHPNFNKAEFFGALRSFATRTDCLAVITSSRLSVARMNHKSAELNPYGSPFFNNSIEVRLAPFSEAEVQELVTSALKRAGDEISFSSEDYSILLKLSGKHPFLVQVAGSAIYDAIVDGKEGRMRYDRATNLYNERTMAHFEDVEITRRNEMNKPSAIRVFLSYTRADSTQVEQLYQKLVQAGYKPWIDTKDILPWEQWLPAIKRAVRKSDFFIACLSKNSVNRRGTIQREIKEALDVWDEKTISDIYLIPLRLEKCPSPEELEKFQWVDLFKPDGWDKLFQALQVGMERRNN